MAIDDSNRRIALFTSEEEQITLWYDKFERRLYVEDKNSLIKYLSDGQTYIPAKIEPTVILYSVAINGVLSIKFSQVVDRRTLNTITVTDVQNSGASSAKVVNFLENDTLVLMKYENADTMIVQGTVTDQLKNEISFSNLVAWPVIYRLFPSEEKLREFWKVNQKKLTSIATEDVTDKDFNFDYSNTTDSGYKWLNEDWKTFYYDPTTNKSYESPKTAKDLPLEYDGMWALCYLREIPVGFEGEKEGPYWYATNFKYDGSRIEMTGWIGDINSHFDVEKLYDSYSAVDNIFASVEEVLKYYEENKNLGNKMFDSFIYTKNDNWFVGSKGKQIQDGFVLLIAPEENVLAFSFKEYQLSEITKIAGAAKLGTNVYFEKKNYGTEQDTVSQYVILARNNDGGLYNATKETFYDDSAYSSPSGTEWNSQYTDSNKNGYGWNDLSNVESRLYSSFHQALNGSIGNNILNTELVMRDKMTGQYWKFDFHSWTPGGNGGGFSYTRTLIQ
jgi:hypothetical protein